MSLLLSPNNPYAFSSSLFQLAVCFIQQSVSYSPEGNSGSNLANLTSIWSDDWMGVTWEFLGSVDVIIVAVVWVGLCYWISYGYWHGEEARNN